MLRRMLNEIRAVFFEEEPGELAGTSRWRAWMRFWVLVGKDFVRNRCPVRASALAYSSLLAFIPLFAVVIGIATGVLKGQEDRIRSNIDLLLANLVPQIKENPEFVDMKDKIIGYTWDGIDKVNSGTIGTSGAVALLAVVIFMLARVEETLNDIWGVSKGRTWYNRVVNYWAAISLGPVVILAAISFSAALRLERTQEILKMLPLVGSLLIKLSPVPIVGGAFALFYALVPNTKVRWRAALMGGLTAAVLWYLLNQVSFLFVSQVNRSSQIFGKLVPIPVFMAGLYFSWLLFLFGSQVACAYQTRGSHRSLRQSDRVHQDGRELVALRVMVEVGRAFAEGREGPSTALLAERLEVPVELVGRIATVLLATRLVVEANGVETGLAPARPLERIRVAEVLAAMRRGLGDRLPTREGEARAKVEGVLGEVAEAEMRAGSRTLADLVGQG
jgi:membrane protein